MAQFFYRVEFREAKLLRECRRDAFDVAVVQARYIAPDVDGSQSEPADLLDALRTCGAPWLIDLGTPQLCDANIVADGGHARLRATPYGSALPLPLEPVALASPDACAALVDGAAALQIGAPMISAPYLEFSDERDPRLKANLEMLRRIVGAAGDRTAVGFVEVTLDALNRGVAARAARRYAATGVRIVLLRVRNLKPERASAKQAAAYESTIDAYRATGIGVVADQVGRFGAFAAACGAIGFSGGTQHFRSVPQRAVTLGGGGGGTKLLVELPKKWVAVPRDVIPMTIDCPVADCAVATGDRSLAALREHDLHYQRHLALLADDELALIADLRGSDEPQALAWAKVLEERRRRSA